MSTPSNHTGAGNHGVLKSVDGDSKTKWCGHHRNQAIQWQLKLPEEKGKIVRAYSITSANDVPSRDPKEWILEGSQNGWKWTKLDHKKEQPLFEERLQTRRFALKNEVPWKFYRFTFLASNDPTHYQFSEIALDGVSMGGVTLATSDHSLSLEDAKEIGARNSRYLKPGSKRTAKNEEAPKADLAVFANEIQPILEQACSSCHGPEKQKADFRVDTLDPNLLAGKDVSWWVEVIDVVSNDEMPPADDEIELSDEDRSKVVEWLSQELQTASLHRRAEGGHTSFRRLTRYEYNYALQDLLGLPGRDFGNDLPPEATSEDGFKNSSETLQISGRQFEQYRELGRKALQRATVKGEKPSELYWAIKPADAVEKIYLQRKDPKLSKNDQEKNKARKVNTSSPHYLDRESGEAVSNPRYNLREKSYPSVESLPVVPSTSEKGIVLTGRGKVVFNLGPDLPDQGNLRVRVRASRLSDTGGPPSLRLYYGFQASNNSHAIVQIANQDLIVGKEDFYQWTVPLEDITRNPFRGQKIAKVNSTESIVLENTNPKTNTQIFIDYVEVTSPARDQWPPASHTNLLPDPADADEMTYARRILGDFMQASWRRDISKEEIDRKLAFYAKIRPGFDDRQDALIETMANILASPNFLYLVQSREPDQFEIATRLSTFLWSSIPDKPLLELAKNGKLQQLEELQRQVKRLLADPRSERFSRHFVRQWLGMELLDFLDVDRKAYRQFSPELKQSMQEEPVAFFNELLGNNLDIMDFLHADYAIVNATLSQHYRLAGGEDLGAHFRKVPLDSEERGGLLTQAGLLAMNSDGKDSHPLKRGIWLLEKMLNDPPPPPPPSVPEIDIADPKIAQMTLKERMEDHRSAAACMSCHARIDPWGIAFENYDAIGSWRNDINREPVDASATLFNGEELNGIEGLKRYLLLHRQDQFANALVQKLTAYALGRPISFADRAELEEITTSLRQQGDGLSTLITLIATSELFQKQ